MVILDVPLKDPTNYLGILRQLRSHFKTLNAAHPRRRIRDLRLLRHTSHARVLAAACFQRGNSRDDPTIHPAGIRAGRPSITKSSPPATKPETPPPSSSSYFPPSAKPEISTQVNKSMSNSVSKSPASSRLARKPPAPRRNSSKAPASPTPTSTTNATSCPSFNPASSK